MFYLNKVVSSPRWNIWTTLQRNLLWKCEQHFIMKVRVSHFRKTIFPSLFMSTETLRDTWERHYCTEIIKSLLVNKKRFLSYTGLPIKKSHHLIPLWSKMGSWWTDTQCTTERSGKEINRQAGINAAKINCLWTELFPKTVVPNFNVHENHLESPLQIQVFEYHHTESESQGTRNSRLSKCLRCFWFR